MSDPSGHGGDRSTAQARDRWLGRILREGAVPELLEALAERLSPTDLQTLLLEVCRRRAATVTPARLLHAYERNRFTRPSALDAGELARLESLVHGRLSERAFTTVALSPLCPLGTVSAVATADQNKVVTTVRTTEVVADATNALALECAVRRRELLRSDPRSRRRVRLAAVHRVVRAQAFAVPGMAAHFALLGLCTAGRDEGSFTFETAALAEQIGVHLDILHSARALGYQITAVRVSVTDLTAGRHRRALREDVLDQLAQAYPSTAFAFDDDRTGGRGYYRDACFEIRATTPAGDDLNLGDGGLVTWSADLLGNAKERLLISGLGLERLCERFGPPACGDQTGIRPM
ncbi:hypothetical protein HTZ77_16780 [Nonomuraea sp. SMC257]|uniref:Uncharacterized protein n=1 Tax=Nonomuraea montanisoli TaxID=2741721 RepID=A0A7Y6I7D5_9ACTN|nr:hypothetical protein [Nonomuraea montanisoli]NUW33075.1 hypothetical protein [Nonomuraea montanisoli]